MDGAGTTVAVYEAEDGILLLGKEADLAVFDSVEGAVSRRLTTRHAARVAGHAGAAGGKLIAESGRWVKLTSESAAEVKAALGGPGQLTAGVLRGDKGRITRHVRFENLTKVGALTPAAPAVLGAMATQYAMESALDEITAYLEAIDAKLDQLLKQRKTETLGQIGGVTLAIEEAAAIYEATGSVSSVTWSKVQAPSLTLQTLQAEAIEQLRVLGEEVAAATGKVDRSAKVLSRVAEDVRFWLGVLARTIALQDRQYVLELARVADDDETQLESHHSGISTARAQRVRRIVQSLEAISAAVHAAAQLSNAAKVANPLSAPRVVQQANDIADDIAIFAQHADLEFTAAGTVGLTRWSRAARILAEQASETVRTEVGGRTRAVGQSVQERLIERDLRRAVKKQERRPPEA